MLMMLTHYNDNNQSNVSITEFSKYIISFQSCHIKLQWRHITSIITLRSQASPQTLVSPLDLLSVLIVFGVFLKSICSGYRC